MSVAIDFVSLITHRVFRIAFAMQFSLTWKAWLLLRSASLCLLVVAVALAANTAAGSIINNITLQLGQSIGESGEGFSVLHNAAAGGAGDNETRLINASLSGASVQIGLQGNRLSGQYDTVSKILTITGTVPDSFAHDSLTLGNGNLVDSNSLVITGGKLIIDGTFGGGYLDYSLKIDHAGDGEFETTTGTFYFANRQETESPTGPTLPNPGTWDGATLVFAERGNNWTYAYAGVDWSFLHEILGKNGPDGLDYYNAYHNRLGIDLLGSGAAVLAPVPEPVSLLVWVSIAMVGLFAGRKRGVHCR